MLCMSRGGVPGGGAVVLDVTQLETLLARTFNRAGRRPAHGEGRPSPAAAVQGAARRRRDEGDGVGEALAIERGVATEQIAAAEGLALHAAAFNGMPDPVLHLAARAMGLVTGLATPGPDPRAPSADMLPDAARQAATARLTGAAAELGQATDVLHGLIELAEMSGRSGRAGKTDLN